MFKILSYQLWKSNLSLLNTSKFFLWKIFSEKQICLRIRDGKSYVEKSFVYTSEMTLDSGDTHDNKGMAKNLALSVLKDGVSYEETGKNCMWNSQFFY